MENDTSTQSTFCGGFVLFGLVWFGLVLQVRMERVPFEVQNPEQRRVTVDHPKPTALQLLRI